MTFLEYLSHRNTMSLLDFLILRQQTRMRNRAAWAACCKGMGFCPTGGCPLDNTVQ